MYTLETIVSRAKRKGFVYPGSDIYGGLANARDYGPYGVQLKKNIQDLRRKTFVTSRPDMVGLDAQILMHPKVRESSGHVANFDDPLIDDKITKERFRADKIIEDRIEEMRKDGKTEEQLLAHAKELLGVENLIPEAWSYEKMREFILQELPNNPNTGKKADRTEVRKFQMMFYTYQGVVHDSEDAKVWLRPETAQGIFVNFRNILDTTRVRVPFGIAQIGKAFRNEITPKNFLYRTREFEQMEIEYFVENDPEKAGEAFEMWKDLSMNRWKEKMNLNPERVQFREHESDELSHYSAGTFDVDYHFPWGRGELQGIAYRTDFDLKNHQEHSGKNMQYNDPMTGKRYVPHVIEPSFGLSRMLLTVLLDKYDEEEYTDSNDRQQTRVVVRFPFSIAPVKVAIFPLIKKNEQQVQIAQTIYDQLSKFLPVEMDVQGAIGKRYRRQDEIGTPYCITVDHDSLESGLVTVRDRDSMEQESIAIADVISFFVGKME